MVNKQQLDLFKQGVATAINKWGKEHPGTSELGQSGAQEPGGGR